jgi:hypothetical protein
VSTADLLQRLLDPSYAAELPSRTTEDLRDMRSECAELEHAVSYYRRLAQGRIEILDAERGRRERGGSVEELIAELPQILGGQGDRPSAPNARFADPDVPTIELRFPSGEEQLVADDTLAQLPRLSDAQLADALGALHAFESALSAARQGLHGVLDRIEHELATRQAAGTFG